MAFDLQLALGGSLVGLQVSDDKLAENTGILARSPFRDLYMVTIDGRTILVDEEGKVKSCAPSDSRFTAGTQLHVINKSLAALQTPSYGAIAHLTRTPTSGEKDTVIINKLTPRDTFAMNVLRNMLKKHSPETVDDAKLLFFCRAAYRWAHGMMSAAADARHGIEGSQDEPIEAPDEWIIDEIEKIDQAINDAEERLKEIHNWSADEVNQAVKDAFKDWSWFKAYADEHGLDGAFHLQEWDDDLKQWLNAVVDVSSSDTGKWSKFVQSVSAIDLEVTQIKKDLEDLDLSEVVQSAFNIGVEDWEGFATAVATLTSMWAEAEEDEDGNVNVLSWMLAAYNQYANQNKSLAEVIADAHDDAVGDATAALGVTVEKQEDGTFKATTTLASMVSDEVDGKISSSGFITENTLGDAFSTMYSDLQSEGGGKLRSAVETRVKDEIGRDGSPIRTAIAQLVVYDPDNPQSFASVFVKSNKLEELVAGLIAKEGDVKASVQAAVKNDKSLIELIADEVTISADDILLDGDVTVKGKLEAIEGMFDSVEAHSLHVWSSEGVDQYSSFAQHIEIKDGEILGYKAIVNHDHHTQIKKPRFAFLADGSGYLAQKAINWDEDGSIMLDDTNGISIVRGYEGIKTTDPETGEETAVHYSRQMSLSSEYLDITYDDRDFGYKRIVVSPYSGISLYRGEYNIVTSVTENGIYSGSGTFDTIFASGVYINYDPGDGSIEQYGNDYVVLAGGGVIKLSDIPGVGGGGDVYSSSTNTFTENQKISGTKKLYFGESDYIGRSTQTRTKKDGTLESKTMLTFYASEGTKFTSSYPIESNNGFRKTGKTDTDVLLAGGGSINLSDLMTDVVNNLCAKLGSTVNQRISSRYQAYLDSNNKFIGKTSIWITSSISQITVGKYFYYDGTLSYQNVAKKTLLRPIFYCVSKSGNTYLLKLLMVKKNSNTSAGIRYFNTTFDLQKGPMTVEPNSLDNSNVDYYTFTESDVNSHCQTIISQLNTKIYMNATVNNNGSSGSSMVLTVNDPYPDDIIGYFIGS